MIIYSKERLVPTDVNMLVIRSKDNEGFFYIHRALYDQAVIINDIYGEDPKVLIKSLTNQEESRPDVDYFLETAPVPINILGPFLLLIKGEIEDFVDMVGALHVMSGPLHFRNMLKIPYDMRNMMPTFSLSIKEEYELAWDRFLQNTMPYSPDMFRKQGNTPMNGVQTSTIPGDYGDEEQDEEELEGYEGTGVTASVMDFLFSDEDPFAELDEEDAGSEADEESVPTVSQAADTVVEQEVVEEPEPESEAKPMTMLDNMLAL